MTALGEGDLRTQFDPGAQNVAAGLTVTGG
jgi:hypothetical protein